VSLPPWNTSVISEWHHCIRTPEETVYQCVHTLKAELSKVVRQLDSLKNLQVLGRKSFYRCGQDGGSLWTRNVRSKGIVYCFSGPLGTVNRTVVEPGNVAADYGRIQLLIMDQKRKPTTSTHVRLRTVQIFINRLLFILISLHQATSYQNLN
jgi:hypothetical protein